jgi:hypothetical protein
MPAQANSLPDCILKTPITKKKKADVVAQDEGSEFKPQHCKKKKKAVIFAWQVVCLAIPSAIPFFGNSCLHCFLYRCY